MRKPIPSPRRELARQASLPDEHIDLARAALLIAREEYLQLPIDRYLARLDQLAEQVRDRLGEETAPLLILHELLSTLYERNAFRGNRGAYYDPRNSYLSDVLDRRLGIPLTLGIVILEVGWRLGLCLEGVGFPGHFVVRYVGEEIKVLVDPFDGGRILFEADAQGLLDRVYGGTVRLRPCFLKAVGKRDMLVRLLTNLKGIYLDVQDHARALSVVERILLIRPTAPGEIRDRGTLLARLGRPDEAIPQLEWYLDAAPEAPDAERIRTLVATLRDSARAEGSV
jgi:regulator of sirC expression with transglutaminase-like and TPR domain